MSKAFIYPGQGAQAVGMASDFLSSDLAQKANDICGFDLIGIMKEGPAESLQSTSYCQPALFLHSALVLEAMDKQGVSNDADYHLGLSLGEYSALYGAGVMSFEDVMKALVVRGKAMQDACEENEGGMVSVIGLNADKVVEAVDAAREDGVLQAANFNSPDQIVISGDKAALERSLPILKEAGARRALPLKVAGAFHSPLMKSAGEKLEECLKNCQFHEGAEKVISNVSADSHQKDVIIETLVKQITSPVRWSQSIESLVSKGVTEFYELGTGKVLSGLVKRISKDVSLSQVSNSEELQAVFGVAE